MTRAKEILESKNYTVKTLNLPAENKIPDDADLIIIAGPVQPITENEQKLLREYLAGGGSLIVMEDPLIVTDFGDQADPLAKLLLDDWGISINNDVVSISTAQTP
ncbi:MAG: Gldg family protein [Anaerolineae bacterium]|nr:Gldg family protein [Anaerolineae bacterium]